jgi:phosphoglycerol transferase MdoB-like AlkP superfamily enzyme
MVCKIIDNFEILSQKLNDLKIYNIFLYNNCLYVSDVNNSEDFFEKINGMFADSEKYKINENNLIYETQNIIEWVKKELVKADLIQYEKDNQEKLINAMKILDSVEEELFGGRECQWQKKNEKEVGLLKKLITKMSMKIKNK